MDAPYQHFSNINTRAHLRRGFSILEMSIIILVLAFFIVLVTVGKDVLDAAETRFLISEANEIKGAVVQFQDVYEALPGDMGDAWNQWNWGGTCADADGDCNGNGDEQIFWHREAGTNTRHEGAQAWQHLQLSEILGGDTLSGVGGALLPGGNAPASTIPSAGYVLSYVSGGVGIDGGYNFIVISLGTDFRIGTPLTPEHALTVDTKMDNNNPYRGRVGSVLQMSEAQGLLNCINDPAGTPTYNLTNETPACNLYFRLDEQQ